MAQPLSGPGIGLPFPQYLYPSQVFGVAADLSTNGIGLNAGDSVLIPPGDYNVEPGKYCMLQIMDPITGTWRTNVGFRQCMQRIKSDGSNFRLWNCTGMIVGGLVTTAGTGYAQATTTITPSTGTSTWYPIIGGGLVVSTIANAGGGFGMTPIVLIPAPPPFVATGVPAVPAAAHAVISGGSVSTVTLDVKGAGYTAATVTGLILPNPYDPNVGTATAGSVLFTLTNSSVLTAAVCTNPGAPIVNASVNAVTLTVTGAGSSAACTPVVAQTIVSATISVGGAGFGTSLAAGFITAGGQNTTTSSQAQAPVENNFTPRQAVGTAAVASGGSITASTITFQDTGLFTAQPIFLPQTQTGLLTASVVMGSVVMGSTFDTVYMQPST
jgi:hypothetical protein